MILSVGKPVEEFRTFLHDGKVSGKGGIEYIVHADLFEGAYEFAESGILDA
jgi:hypothetical protein